jgi:histidinol-phosphate phosphatase family protein
MNSFLTQINPSWTLFLDRDGVINKKIDNDYVRTWSQFEFLPGVFDALKMLSSKFGKIIIVTNQQGIGKQWMKEEHLNDIHANMLKAIQQTGGRIDKIYFSPHLKSENSDYRKPEIGMALHAKKDFPEIDFSRSVMVGDSYHDMAFGKNAGMKTVFISHEEVPPNMLDMRVNSLKEFADLLY